MSLFDQQPMGPIPARSPILSPPDPELEAEFPDPGAVEVELVGPLPEELSYPVAPVPAVSATRLLLKRALAVLLLTLMIGGFPETLIVLTQESLAGEVPSTAGLTVLAAMFAVTAVVLWRHRNLR